jgi:CubicO group peptidase (beta-lactamase class C family)
MVKRLQDQVREGIHRGVFPGAVLLVAQAEQTVFFEAAGNSSIVPHPGPMKKEAIFDVASLTKPLATTLAMMKLANESDVRLDQPLSELLPSSLGEKRELTPRLLLSHSAGLADWKPFYEKLVDLPLKARKRVLREWIIEEPFFYEPGKGAAYSDLGFMLLEWVIEEKTGESLPEFVQRHFYGPLGLKRTFFLGTSETGNPPQPPFTKEGRETGSWDSRFHGNDTHDLENIGMNYAKDEFAATEDCPWRKKVLQGEVHDDNAWALGGYSGHAGLFSDAEGVYAIANMLREHYYGMRRDFFRPETVREFLNRQDIVEGSDWALGWDTRALEGSSAGKYFSRDSVGHTGFTGTSIWMDLEKDVIAIFLTNRVHPKRDNDKIKQFRPVLHDSIMEALGLVNKPQTHTDILAERLARPKEPEIWNDKTQMINKMQRKKARPGDE